MLAISKNIFRNSKFIYIKAPALKHKLFLYIICSFCSIHIGAQTNNIVINAEIDVATNIIKVQQEITFFNKTEVPLQSIYLHNWQNAFKNRKSPLTKRLIEDYRKALYFAKEEERGYTQIINLTENYKNTSFSELKKQQDILKIVLNKPLQPGDSTLINATYLVKIPDAKFTGYGKTISGYHLRYWYLVPAVFDKKWQLMSHLNIDDLFMDITNYSINFKAPKEYIITTNLPITKKKGNSYYFNGKHRTDILINLSKNKRFNRYKTRGLDVITDIPFRDLNNTLATNILNREIEFIEGFLGKYPHSEIVLDEITQKKNPIYGLNQLPKFLNTFSDVFDRDLTLFKALTKKYIDNTLLLNRRTDYWLIDGIQSYLLMEYVRKHYPEVKLMGAISDSRLLKSFNASKLKFNDKYAFVYQFITRKFLDQSLTTQLDSLSNFNRKIGNKYKAGLGLQYLSGYLGKEIVKSSIKDFYANHNLTLSTSLDFKKIITSKTTKNLDWFFGDYLHTNKKIDYTIKKVTTNNDSLQIVIKNKRNITAPVALYGIKDKKILFKTWVDGVKNSRTINIPKGDFDKVSLNYEQIYPEYNSLDNWKTTNKSIINKPLQLRPIKDLSDPYYNQLFYQPVIDYNYYDGLSLGIKIHNKPIIKRNLSFKFIPKYATKSNTLTGSTSIMYSQFFEQSKLHSLIYGVSASNYHYAPELSYSVFVPYISAVFNRKTLRDVGGKFLMAKYVNINKEPAPNSIGKEQDKYAILNLKYVYSQPNIINGFSYKFNTDIASKFTKVSTDIRFRSLTSNDRQLDFRFFGGVFLTNNTTGNYFSFGLDRPSDYLFEQNYFGRSESSGIFSQQFIINDGGFKSVLPTRFANQYMFSLNSSIGIWKWVEYYNDVAFLKNKGESMYFAYENGIRLNFIHNILEVYFPTYSNLGWEVNQEAYPSKIRFVLTMKPTAIYNFFRRGFL